ncbi:YggS family pyridoxal phosphate-dependent enzyme [Bacteroidota bacterium]
MTKVDLRNNFSVVKERVEGAAKRCGRDAKDITIVAVSKTHTVDYIINGMEAGVEIFGENYVQELRDKHGFLTENNLPQPEWHYIGHLQRNKVKYIAPFVSIIHSVDSERLAEEISKQAQKTGRIIDILLQVNTSGEDSKSGCEPGDTESMLKNIINIDNLCILGLMTIGSFSEDEDIYRKEFRLLRSVRDELQSKFPEVNLKHLSMGMTHDYEAAIEEGATIVRVGTAIFGQRFYKQ